MRGQNLLTEGSLRRIDFEIKAESSWYLKQPGERRKSSQSPK